MAINRKGMRPINVEGDVYLWRFGADIVSIFQETPFGEIRVTYGFIPSIEDLGDSERLARIDKFEANAITPAFIARAIQFARRHDWKDGRIELDYKNSQFSVPQ